MNVKQEVADLAAEIVEELRADDSLDVGDVGDVVFKYVYLWWGSRVQVKPFRKYSKRDFIHTLPACAEIIRYAKTVGMLAGDASLWEGLTFGAVPALAFFSTEQMVCDAVQQAMDAVPA